jgi:type VI secretion system secreted protein Hcp
MQKIIFVFAMTALLPLSGLANFQFVTPAEAAAVDYYLKLGDIKGEAADSRYKDWIDVESFSFGVSSTGTMGSGGGGGAGKGAGKASFGALSLVKALDKSTPLLMLECASGKHFPTAELVLVKSGSEIMKWTLSDILISSYQIDGKDTTPTDSFSLNFAKIVVEYNSATGPVKVGWDIKANKRI